MANCKCGATMIERDGLLVCSRNCGGQRSIVKQQSLGELLSESREKIERLETENKILLGIIEDLHYEAK